MTFTCRSKVAFSPFEYDRMPVKVSQAQTQSVPEPSQLNQRTPHRSFALLVQEASQSNCEDQVLPCNHQTPCIRVNRPTRICRNSLPSLAGSPCTDLKKDHHRGHKKPHLRCCVGGVVRGMTQHELSAQPRCFGLSHCCSFQSVQGPVPQQPRRFLHCSLRVGHQAQSKLLQII